MEKIKLFEMFAGYGGGSFAMAKAEIPYECVGYSEIKNNAIKIFELNHKNIKNYGDCKLINPIELPDFNLLTGGFPCQDVSSAGLRDLSKGRTKLFEEIIRIAEVKKPRFMLLENVKGLLSKKEYFKFILNELERIGYFVKYEILNSSDYGIPQSRKRIFFACFLNKGDFDNFEFPKKEISEKLIEDFLDKEIDEKYYLKQDKKWMIENQRYRFVGAKNKSIVTLTGGHSKGWDDIRIVEACAFRTYPRNKAGQDRDKFLEVSRNNLLNCITSVNSDSMLLINGNKIRYMTPNERLRFMGFDDGEIKVEGLAPTSIMDLTGNGWDINLVSKIFQQMFKDSLALRLGTGCTEENKR